MNLRLLASTVAYILGEGGPYHQLDPTNLTIEFRAYWTRYDDDATLSYLGPDEISVTIPSA